MRKKKKKNIQKNCSLFKIKLKKLKLIYIFLYKSLLYKINHKKRRIKKKTK